MCQRNPYHAAVPLTRQEVTILAVPVVFILTLLLILAGVI